MPLHSEPPRFPDLQAAILQAIPKSGFSLVLVSDPDELLADNSVLEALQTQGFTLIRADDVVRLRYQLHHTPPPHLIITTGALEDLPYDLWWEGHKVNLRLSHYFPTLALPLVRALNPSQRARLYQAPLPRHPLGFQSSLEFIFRHVFDLDWKVLENPITLVAWLSQTDHIQSLPFLFRTELFKRLKSLPAYRDWPLDDLVERPEALQAFLTAQGWLEKPGRKSGLGMAEPPPSSSYRTTPAGPERYAQLCDQIEAVLSNSPPDSFEAWEQIAWQWAELNRIFITSESLPKGGEQFETLRHHLDKIFLEWLKKNYAPLAVQVLPRPHHLYHVPTFLAQQQHHYGRIALVVMDGMSLGNWEVIWADWQQRYPRWQSQVSLVLAQVPTITAISRQALLSGKRPVEFAASLTHNHHEGKLWLEFWHHAGIGEQRCWYGNNLKAAPDQTDVDVIGLVINDLDTLLHNNTLGAKGLRVNLSLWCQEKGHLLAQKINTWLNAGYEVWLISDHGNIEAQGMGQPHEGLIVETRGLRARIYRDEKLAHKIQQDFGDTLLWHADGLLPEDIWVLIPQGRQAFAPLGETVTAHGGLTLDEVFVPLVHIYSP